jgi:glycine betaine/choline ABC-type transport system substrate-binding protein
MHKSFLIQRLSDGLFYNLKGQWDKRTIGLTSSFVSKEDALSYLKNVYEINQDYTIVEVYYSFK